MTLLTSRKPDPAVAVRLEHERRVLQAAILVRDAAAVRRVLPEDCTAVRGRGGSAHCCRRTTGGKRVNPYAPTSPYHAVAQRIIDAGRWLTYRDLGVTPNTAARVRARLRQAGALGYKVTHCAQCGRVAKAALCWRCQGVKNGP